MALYLARHIAPDWIEERGCVLRREAFESSNLDEWWATTNGDQTAIEAAINHVHLWDVLPTTNERDYGDLWAVGDVMVAAWRAGLARSFPDRPFDVTLSDDYGPTVNAVSIR